MTAGAALGHAGAEDFRCFAVRCGDPRGVDAQRGRPSPTMPETACDGAQIYSSAK
jgi:hypothetical protein